MSFPTPLFFRYHLPLKEYQLTLPTKTKKLSTISVIKIFKLIIFFLFCLDAIRCYRLIFLLNIKLKVQKILYNYIDVTLVEIHRRFHWHQRWIFLFKERFFWDFLFNFYFFIYYIQHCFICRPSDSTDAGIEPRTVATGALALGSQTL
jgi:hypothetical protein